LQFCERQAPAAYHAGLLGMPLVLCYSAAGTCE